MKFNTENSSYEVELYPDWIPDARTMGRVRRLSGAVDPTPRQGPDGVWKDFEAMTVVQVGYPVVFMWAVTDKGVVQTTVTSNVTSMETEDPDDRMSGLRRPAEASG